MASTKVLWKELHLVQKKAGNLVDMRELLLAVLMETKLVAWKEESWVMMLVGMKGDW